MTLAPAIDSLIELRTTGEKLPPRLRDAILSLGSAAIAPLIALLDDDKMEDAPGDGWPPIHAVRLLAALNATEAIPTLLRVLCEADWESTLHNEVELRLPELGAPVLEPGLAALATTDDFEARESLCCVLAKLGIHDERVFTALCELFEEDMVIGAFCFSDYGDERAVPMLRAAIEEEVPDWTSPFGLRDLVELVAAYEHIEGALPPDLRKHVDAQKEEWSRKRAERAAQPVATRRKVGRNEACPCGSGKKYKKCCIGKLLPA